MVRSLSVRILVTGAGGFIGSHVVENLLEKGHQVTAICKYNSEGNFGWLDTEENSNNSNLDMQLGDVTDTEYIERVTKGIDTIVNLAALIGIPYSYIAPRSYLNVNTLGAMNLLEAARKHDARLIQISTSEVYGNPVSVPISLEHRINPQSPYAASKASADLLCKSYHDSFNSKVLIVRPFNTYGPRQSLRAVIPTILSQIANGKEKIEIGSLHVKRDFTYVTDTAVGISLAAESDFSNGEIVQLGTGSSISVNQIIEICKAEFNSEITIEAKIGRIRPARSEIQILESDPSSAKYLLNWEAKTDLIQGLRRTYEWIKTQESTKRILTKYHV